MREGITVGDRPLPEVRGGLSSERQVEIMTWLKYLPPHEHDQAAQSMLRAGGDEAEFVGWLLSKDHRRHGESPHDKKTNPPQTK